MGNRAVLAFVNDEGKKDKNSVGIYLHWNGGRDSVEGFLQTAKDYELRSGSYGVARLTQIIANGLGGTLSLGVDLLKNLDCDNYDNGVYWIDQNFNIVDREYINRPDFKEQQQYSLTSFVRRLKQDNDKFFKANPLR
tara:strand:- start:266 stop:676 length:411 start_codon:yes stop_codon:yes gene_type:complete